MIYQHEDLMPRWVEFMSHYSGGLPLAARVLRKAAELYPQTRRFDGRPSVTLALTGAATALRLGRRAADSIALESMRHALRFDARVGLAADGRPSLSDYYLAAGPEEVVRLMIETAEALERASEGGRTCQRAA